jgi:lysylphosphatidylglycerol synthetase-like protein (DUF2156 family)
VFPLAGTVSAMDGVCVPPFPDEPALACAAAVVVAVLACAAVAAVAVLVVAVLACAAVAAVAVLVVAVLACAAVAAAAVLVAGGVVVAAVVVVVVVAPLVVLEPVEPVEPLGTFGGLVGPRWSSVLSVAGVNAGVEAGTLSVTFVPPQAASATPPSVAAASSAKGRARRAITVRAEACAGRTSGSR